MTLPGQTPIKALMVVLLLLITTQAVVSETILLEDAIEPSSSTGTGTSVEVGLYAPANPLLQIDAPKHGTGHTCFVDSSNGVHCFGDNQYGQLGDGTTSDRKSPTPVVGLSSGVSKVATGASHTCALLNNGSVKCWGYGQYGNLGNGDTEGSSYPVFTSTFGSGRTSVDIAAGDSHTCVILDDGSVKCWGDGGNGRLGNGGTNRKSSPTATYSLGAGRTAVSLSLGGGHSCALLDDGSIKCWGMNSYGQIGTGSTTNSYTSPTAVSAFSNSRTAVQLSAGWMHTCAILNDGNVSCWGMNDQGQLGNNGTSNSRSPTYVVMDGVAGTFQSLSAGYKTTCGKIGSSEAVCWGWNGAGQVGDGTKTNRLTPTLVSNLTEGDVLVNLTASRYHTCASFTDGSLRCWGDNSDTRLGVDYSLAQELLQPSGAPVGAVDASSVTEIVEGQEMTILLRLHGFEPSSTNISIDVPPGMTVNTTNWTISGTPSFTLVDTWNVTLNTSGNLAVVPYNLEILRDTDGDGTANKYDSDDDGDLVADDADSCQIEWGNSTIDREGCPDADGDGVSDLGDDFPREKTQQYDSDQDGFGDNLTGTRGDDCPSQYGESRRGGVWGCPDSDYDGWDDGNDSFPQQSSQWNDSDGDGYGDEYTGFEGDACPTISGNSTNDRFGCVDSDGDGYSDSGDDLPNDPTQHSDRDGDGYGDNQSKNATKVDKFPSDGTQWLDHDGDGYGDNPNGTNGDAFPNDNARWSDRDKDGYSDQGDDAFMNDVTQWNDTDGDGYGDNQNGSNADRFPNDSSEWFDSDGDGVGDNADEFKFDGSQSADADNDGYGDNPNGTNGDQFPNDGLRWSDRDGDGYSDQEGDDEFINDPSQWNDTDGDGYGDNANGNNPDAFVNDASEWKDTDGDGVGNNGDWAPSDGTQWADADSDGFGDNPNGTNGDQFLNDTLRWSDTDGDGSSDQENDDAFPLDPSQWSDQDGDGFGDNPNGTRADAFPADASEWSDVDGDGVGDNSDAFPFDGSQSTDRDGDGYGDNPDGLNADAFPDDPTRYRDFDGDGVADEDDLFPNDASQVADTDGDGFGDAANGTRPDAFPNDPTEWNDLDGDGVGDNSDAFVQDGTQWNDTDGDGYGDNLNGNNGDAFPNNPLRWSDADGDGVADEDDAFPNEPTQSEDRDGDGYGDAPDGAKADRFPDDASEWLDTDNDGVGDNSDRFRFDPTQTTDRDGDGYGDNATGTNGDAFPDEATQWSDIDGDGLGDNLLGLNPDAFPNDATQWSDTDGDGYGDNLNGRNADLFPDNPTQHADADGDGLGDNQSGTDADPSLNDFDNDGYTDDEDTLPKLASPGDKDNDGVPDEEDAFPDDFRESKDSDGDGEGDNADSDDDNDGWSDVDEVRVGMDPYNSASQPVEGFEILVPGTQVSLGAWDIIGIFTGVPLALWVSVGLMTRTNRGRRFEADLNDATSLQDLNRIAAGYESALMWKMLGPHQGLRLERIRTELERDKFAGEMKALPEIKEDVSPPSEPPAAPPADVSSGAETGASSEAPDASTKAQKTDEKGYEWYTTEDGTNYYRVAESGDEWQPFDG